MEVNEEIVEKLRTVAILVAVREMDEWVVYDRKLWKIWNESENHLITDPVRTEENDAGHYVARLYRNRYGYWLSETWIPHFGYSFDGGRVYYIGLRLPI